MNKLDLDYQNLLQDVLDNGVEKKDRTGTGTISIFGRQIRHKISDGFPLLTTKKMAFKTMVTELLWFLRGDTNIKYLVENNCHIWTGDAKKQYDESFIKYWGGKEDRSAKFQPISNKEFEKRILESDDFAKKWGELGPIYGAQWRNWETRKLMSRDDVVGEPQCLPKYFETNEPIDQIANLINDLKTNPDSRRLMVNAWNVGELDQMVLPPCHYGFQVYTRELSLGERQAILEKRGYRGLLNSNAKNYKSGKKLLEVTKQTCDDVDIPTRAISLMWNQRSVDTFLGLPFNIASYGLLLEIIAKAVNMIPDELIGNLGDVHLYSNHIEQAKEQISRESYPLPKLNINTEWWPTESGECGAGPIDATAIFNGFNSDNFCKCLLEEDIQLGKYQSHPTIKAPLSN